MFVLQEIMWIIYHTEINSWEMRLIPELFYTGNHASLTISTDPIILGLINTVLIYPHKTSTLPGI